MADLIQKMKDRMEREDLSQAEFARLLLVSESYLSMLYSRKREPNVDLLSRLRVVYPDLREEIDLFLVQKSTTVMSELQE